MGSDAIKSRPTPLKNRKKGPNSSSFSTISLKRDFASDPNCVSVTKVLKETMPVERRIGLQKWEERMIAEMGKENFLKMQVVLYFIKVWYQSGIINNSGRAMKR